MFNNTKKVINGDPSKIDRDFYNASFDAGVLAKLGNDGILQDGSVDYDTNTNIISFQNKTGVDLGKFDIVGIGSAVIPVAQTGFQTRQVFQAVAPTEGAEFAIMQKAGGTDSVRPAALGGLSVVKINVGSSNHEWAYCTTSLTELTSGNSGNVRILNNLSGTGSQWCLVRFQKHTAPRKIGVFTFDFDPLDLSTTGTANHTIVGSVSNDGSAGVGMSSPTSGIHLSKGGTYKFHFPYQYIALDCSVSAGGGSAVIDDTGGTSQYFRFYVPGKLKAEVYVYDDAGAITDGVIVDRHVMETNRMCGFHTTSGSGPVIEFRREFARSLTNVFSIDQSTIDGLTGNCQIAIYLTFERAEGTGTVTGEFRSNPDDIATNDDGAYSNQIWWYDDPELATKITPGAATPPP